MRRVNIPIFVPHLGCVHDCVFCNQKRITGYSESASAETAKKIIEDAFKTIPKDCKVQIAFFGGSFTAVSKSRQEELLKTAYEYIKSGQAEGIRISTRPDCIEKENLLMLKAYGVTDIELGAQSTDDEVLRICNRGHSYSDIEKSSGLIKEMGFELGLQMMLGLPGDTDEKAVKTAKDIINLKPSCSRIYPTLVIENSPLCDLYKSGKYTPMELFHAVYLAAQIYKMFKENKIEVIRMGLMASEDMQEGKSIVAGPFSPSFGELVHSYLFLEKMREGVKNFKGEDAVVYVNPKDISKATGNKRENIMKIFNEHNVNLKVKPCQSVEEGNLMW